MDTKYEARNADWVENEQYFSNYLPGRHFVPPSTNISQAHLLGAMHGGTFEKTAGKLIVIFLFFSIFPRKIPGRLFPWVALAAVVCAGGLTIAQTTIFHCTKRKTKEKDD